MSEPKDKAFVAGALADAAYAFWKAGKPKEAVTAATEAWVTVDSLPSGKEDLRAFATQKRVGHVIVWLHAVIIPYRTNRLLEPIAGMCSDPAISESIRELEPTESPGVWVFLMQMERKCDAGDKGAKLGKAIVEESKSILIRPLIVEETITRGLLTGDVADLPKKCVELTTASRDAALAYPSLPNKFALGHEPEMFVRGDRFIGAPLFLAGLVSAAAIGTSIATLLGSWRRSVATNPFSKDWNDWFDEIEQSLALPSSAAVALFWSGTGTIESMVLGVLNILCAERCSPEELFAAHARLLRVQRASPWFSEMGEVICRIVERAWMRAIQSPALLRGV